MDHELPMPTQHDISYMYIIFSFIFNFQDAPLINAAIICSHFHLCSETCLGCLIFHACLLAQFDIFYRKIFKVQEYFQFLKMSGFEFGHIGKTCDPSEPGVFLQSQSSDRCCDGDALAHSVIMSQPVPVEEGPVSGYVYYLLYQIDYLKNTGESN